MENKQIPTVTSTSRRIVRFITRARTKGPLSYMRLMILIVRTIRSVCSSKFSAIVSSSAMMMIDELRDGLFGKKVRLANLNNQRQSEPNKYLLIDTFGMC